MAKVIIQYEAETASLKASVSEINKVNDEVVKSAQDSSKKVAEAYKDAGQRAGKAFAEAGVEKAIQSQGQEIVKLAGSLKKLYDEELRLLSSGKQNTAQYQENQKQAAALRQQVENLNKSFSSTSAIVIKTSQDVAKYEERLRELSLAGQRNTKEFDDIARAVGEYKSAIVAADRAVDLYAKSTDAATGRIGELEDKLFDLAIAGKTNSKEYRDLIVEVSGLKRAVLETEKQIDSFVERSRGFGAVVQNVELIGSAFQAIEGASALFGEESEDLQRTLVRLQAITAITSGIEQARVILLEQIAAKTGIASAAQSAYSVVVGTSTGALKLFRIALAASGVGLVVVGLAALVENFDKVKAAAFRVIPGLESFVTGVGNAIDAVKEFFGIVDEQSRPNLADRFIKNEQRRVEAAVNATERRIQLAQAEGKETFRLEIEKEQILLDFAKRKVAIINANEAAIRQAGIDTAQFTFDLQQEILDREATIQAIRLANRRRVVADIEAIESKAIESVTSPELTIGLINSLEEQKKALDEFDKQRSEAEEKRKAEIIQTRELIFQTAKELANLFTQLGALSAQLTENRIAGIEQASQVELDAINNSVQTERQKQREREALELRTSRRIAQEKVKQARLDKAIALFGAVVNTAEAITKALPNVVLAAVAGALGAAQIATIAARPIPKFEKGGAVGGKRHSSGGTLIEAEKDEFVTRRQQSIRHRAELEAINTSTANFNRLIEQRYVRPAIERYMINSARQNLTVRASLNSKSMEKELRTMRKSMGKPVIVNINGKDNRYTWQ